MSDAVQLDTMDLGDFHLSFGIPEDRAPQLVANELRRIYTEHGDPGLYFLVLRAQELEQL